MRVLAVSRGGESCTMRICRECMHACTERGDCGDTPQSNLVTGGQACCDCCPWVRRLAVVVRRTIGIKVGGPFVDFDTTASFKHTLGIIGRFLAPSISACFSAKAPILLVPCAVVAAAATRTREQYNIRTAKGQPTPRPTETYNYNTTSWTLFAACFAVRPSPRPCSLRLITTTTTLISILFIPFLFNSFLTLILL